jgi:exopolyphosphatase/guanosine-5'-triphosphate,3'-diphosphate pyrophosphatase
MNSPATINPFDEKKLQIKKYAAIDIGSNAMRLLITNIVEQDGKQSQFNKNSLVRVPIRLGQDSFTVGEISQENIERMTDAMKAFRLLMKVHKVEKYLAFATSAMREASNAEEVVAIIRKKADIKIEIIDGKKEAVIIASTDLHHLLKTDKTYLYVDVGGGSTEFSLFSNGKIVVSKSFKAGTVRLLNEMVRDVVWKEMEKWVTTNTKDYDEVLLIGSGGNINKLFKMSGKIQDKPLSYIYLNSQYAFLNSLTYEQRISELGLNPDRADVIIPATQIYLNAMKWSGARNIYVPKIGLSDGIVKAMYYGKI